MSKVLIFAVEVDDIDNAFRGEYFDVLNSTHTFNDARMVAVINPDEANHDMHELIKEVL